MSNTRRLIHQNLLDGDYPPIEVETLLESSLTEEFVRKFLGDTPARPIRLGVAPAYSPKSALLAVAIATTSKAFIVQFNKKEESAKSGRQILRSMIFCEPDCQLFAFDLGLLAISLYLDHNIRMLNGVDVQSACAGSGDSTPLKAIKFAVGDHDPVYDANVTLVFESKDWDPKRTTPLAQQAWIASFLPTLSDMEERFNGVKRVNTQDLNDAYLEIIAGLARSDQQLASKRPLTKTHEFSSQLPQGEKVLLQSSRFQSRIQKSSAVMRMSVQDEFGAQYEVHGRTVDTRGPSATLRAETTMLGKTITAVTSIGGERPTSAERQKAIVILKALQGEYNLLENPFLQFIIAPSDTFSWPESWSSSETVPPILAEDLNHSQHQAVEHMLSTANSKRVTVIKGPPGTGKTTVIAAFVCSAVSAGQTGLWLVAQTNVAVKNIAEKLAKVRFFNFKVLVSTDFHLGWHEHLYQRLNANIIRSDEFRIAEKQLNGCPVVLCTLSMLSNPRVQGFMHVVSINTLVVDEASQIAIQDYVPPLSIYSTIQKMCFIGDNKQLPPYGQDEVQELKSVFEVDHLFKSALLLDTQYRMPPCIGDFISKTIYNNELASYKEHPIPSQVMATTFIHVQDATEKKFQTSYVNAEESKAVMKIAEKLEMENKSYRIITPYDAQRNYLEKEMKAFGLRWENKCFNVDSFQGNEDDFIIISLVRTKDLGFLTDLRRTNVMLTRCKRGMYICTSWEFIQVIAKETLVGKMAIEFGDDAWIGMGQLEAGEF